MKTSSKWILAALLLLLGSLTAYNRTLRAEYIRGAYKNPLLNTTALHFKDFTEVDVPAASLLGVRVVAGPYSVRVNKATEKYVRVTQQGTRLLVALAFPEEVKYLGRAEAVTISLPRLRQLTAGGAYSAAGKKLTERYGRGGHVQIDGFRQDSLCVQPDLGARLNLTGNQLGYLRAEAGRTPGSHPVLYLDGHNRIGVADLRVQSQGELQLEAGGIGQLRTVFGDSARATLSGAGLRSLGQR